jgi:hypothetical protein
MPRKPWPDCKRIIYRGRDDQRDAILAELLDIESLLRDDRARNRHALHGTASLAKHPVAGHLAPGLADVVPHLTTGQAGSGRAIVIADLIDLIVDLSSSEKPVLQDEKRLRPANSEVRALLADCTSFVRTTGWSPQVPMRRGLERTVDWWRGRLSASKVRRQRDFIT